ncbi:hypothetical protein CRE_18807 [Caenorhabditis remanei]|uniref:Serpentine receptor class gamma n=1 Tax=Caenorhabditis remanei TaxID=31234 RepID=E3LKI5_CAERE|nr:hypothetical protein CRE_18807 [Caenorhabditis remanei]
MSPGVTSLWVDLPVNIAKEIMTIIQLIYGVPSIVLMLFLIIFLGCSPKYSSSFYRLVQVDLLTNLICWLNTWISLRSSEFAWGTTYIKFFESILPGTWNFSTYLLNFFMHLQFCSAAWMSVHRISSILFFNHYEKFWSRYYMLIALIFCGYSCIPQIPGEYPQMSLVNGSLYFTFYPARVHSFNVQVLTFSVVYFVTLVGLGISVPLIAKYRLRDVVTDSGLSRKLTRIALTYGFVYSGILAWTVINTLQSLFSLFPEWFGKASYAMLSVASDMMTLALPYILLIYDSNIKRDLRNPLESSKITTAIVSS